MEKDPIIDVDLQKEAKEKAIRLLQSNAIQVTDLDHDIEAGKIVIRLSHPI